MTKLKIIEKITVDGKLIDGNVLPIFNDGKEHEILVIMKEKIRDYPCKSV